MDTLIYAERAHAVEMADWYTERGVKVQVRPYGHGFAIWMLKFQAHVDMPEGGRCPLPGFRR